MRNRKEPRNRHSPCTHFLARFSRNLSQSQELVQSAVHYFRSVFQLSELHIYVIPTDLWQVERRLVDTSIIEQCVSVGFVRLAIQ